MTTGLVTGGGRGLGAAIGRALLDDHVVDELIVLDKEVTAAGPSTRTLVCDVTDARSVEAAAAAIGAIDVLVNNAGGGRLVDPTSSAPLDPFATTARQWEEVVALNLSAAHIVTSAFGPALRNGGAICNVASIAGLIPSSFFAYGAAKAGLIHWTKCLAVALAPRQIRVNAVAPGFIYTSLWSDMAPDAVFEAMVSRVVPMGTAQTADDVAHAVSFLCSTRAGQVTGQVLAVDGGASLGPRPG